MNLSKSLEFFDPSIVDSRIHIIGCGSVGSTLAELLARFGLKKFTLYDFDRVEEKNVVNQMFFQNQVGQLKVDAVESMLLAINPALGDSALTGPGSIKKVNTGWHGQKLAGYIFLCVDSIDVRRQIVQENMNNLNIKAMFDFRTRLTDAQHYAARWSDQREKDAFLASMDFTSAEARESTPVSACGVELGVAPTVRAVCNAGVCNFINFVKTGEIKKLILTNPFAFMLDAM